ncbi:DUF2304 domain-containing protein [Enterococcus sp. CSURQ0835]|uniref:DUF2304 domain-containing protein n=1 Tax=Enterococcus sp. CSURQ0835 TaxID=2681394 RepID=UPI001356CE30|nr:DUF2304 domain-containing protein [Enterococcus sp. CSURQ0835]
MDIFSIVMLIAAIFFLYFVIRNINKNTFLLSNAWLWLLIAAGLVVFALIPSIPEYFAQLLGFQLTSNFLLFLAVFFLLLQGLIHSIQSSKQHTQIITLIQEISMLKSKEEQDHHGE